jgi:hypothetical protein
MKLFSRKPEAPAAPAEVKQTCEDVTCGELNAAIAAVRDVVPADSTNRQTIEALWDLTNDAAGGAIVNVKGPAPVNIAALDDAIAALPGPELGLSSGTLATLRGVRAILAREQAARDAEPVEYATVAQLKAHESALFDAFAWALGAMAAELNRGNPSQAHVIDLLNRSASTDERKKLLSGICEFREEDVPKRTRQEWLRYQSTGHY